MNEAVKRDMLVMMAATSIVKNIRPDCLNAAETIATIVDALSTRNNEIDRLQAALHRSETGAKVLRFHLEAAVNYADVAAEMDGMPYGKQCKELTATRLEEGIGVKRIFDVKAARDILENTKHLRDATHQQPSPPNPNR